ncbi:MAG TPA: DUF1150 domain-containing protein [Beijerinckia sp.]|jgi:hypothetical protein|nr:DUF1150 domain-containing protein [Beijerinckia sp.]
MLNENKFTERPVLTDEQLASLGGGQVAYVKPLRSDEVNRLFPQAPALKPGVQLFALLAADGTPILLTDSRDVAVANALQHELEMVSVH